MSSRINRPHRSTFGSRVPTRAFTLIELLVVIAIIAILASVLFPVFAQADFRAQTFPGALRTTKLTVVTNGSVVRKGRTDGCYQFGQVDALSVSSVEHTFVVRNDNAVPVVLDRLGSSCGCASVFVASLKPVAFTKTDSAISKTSKHTLAPGQEVAVRVTVDLTHFKSGKARSFVWVFVSGSTVPAVTLEVAGEILAPISFSPPVLNFGRVPAGTTTSLSLTATIDSRLLASEEMLLVCTNPDIRVVPEPSEVSTAQGGSVGTMRVGSGNKKVTRIYMVKVPQAPLGLLNGTLEFVRMKVPGRTSGAQPSASFVGAPVLLIGEVIGSLSSTPKTAVFGTVPAGKQVTQRIALTGTPAALQNLKVSCNSSFLFGRFVEPVQQGLLPFKSRSMSQSEASNKTTKSVFMDITLAAYTPPGVLKSHVMVVMSNGTRLVLPVFAHVTRATQPEKP